MCVSLSPLKSKNYTLRLLEQSDLAFFINLYQDTELMSLVGQFENKELLEKSFKNTVSLNDKRPFKRLTYCIYYRNEQIGIISLIRSKETEGQCEIGIIVNRDLLKQGIAFEVMQCLIKFTFSKLEIVRVYAKFSKKNNAVYRLVTKLGFIVENAGNNFHYCYIDRSF